MNSDFSYNGIKIVIQAGNEKSQNINYISLIETYMG
jgi:hypothetical protein